MKKITILFLAITLFFSCKKDSGTNSTASTPADLLPKSNEISGWDRSANAWTATSSGELNTYINGEEPTYTRHGFIEASMQEYQGTIQGAVVAIEIRIFDQGSSNNAKALYDELVLQMANPQDWDEAGSEASVERLGLAQRILFHKENYFISLTISSGLDESLNVLKTFALNIDAEI